MRLAALTLLLAVPAAAQRPTTPAHGTPERTAILDAVRTAVINHYNPATAVRLNVRRLGVLDGWALAVVEPRAPSGALLPEYAAGCQCDCEVVSLLRRRDRAWQIVDVDPDPCDAALMDWPAVHGAPAPLLDFYSGSPTVVAGPARVDAPSGEDPWLALRSEPSATRGRRLARMPHGARVEVVSCQEDEALIGDRIGHWCRVRYDGREGWAFDLWLAPLSQ
jgi:hypothetical protein